MRRGFGSEVVRRSGIGDEIGAGDGGEDTGLGGSGKHGLWEGLGNHGSM